jgi:hypothetical protein
MYCHLAIATVARRLVGPHRGEEYWLRWALAR